MEIKNCKRCGEPWCFHGTGRPIRCGKCKSPYWDRERQDAVECRKPSGVDRRVPGTVPNDVLPVESVPVGSDEGAGGDAEAVDMCPYTEYDPEDGETYRCGLAKHGPKVKHTRGRKV